MEEIKWVNSADGGTCVAKVHGGTLVKSAMWLYNYERAESDYVGCAMQFIPDPRITLAGQIAAGLMMELGQQPSTIAEIALDIADEILRQAAKSEAGNG